MPPFRRHILINSLKLFDIFLLIFSFGVATIISHNLLRSISLEQFLAIRISVQNFFLFLGLMLVWHVIFAANGLYHSRRLSSRWEEARDVVKATTLGTLVLSLAGIIFSMVMVSPLFLVIFWLVSSIAGVLGRRLLHYGLEHLRLRGRNLRNLLIAGTNIRAVDFARTILQKPELGYELLGFTDNAWYDDESEMMRLTFPLIPLQELETYLTEHVVDEVVVFLPVKSFYEQYSRIISLCEEQGIIVRLQADLFFTRIAKSRVEHFEDSMLITMYTGTQDGLPLVMKRVMDVVLSLILLVILSPLFLVTALAIRLTSPGPVFFVQERLGLNKRRFRLYKFRTMVVDAEKRQAELEPFNEASGPVFKIKNDPRITPIGRILRKTSIDELPQLLNVLKGDMSLVGPRPLPVRDYREFDQYWYNRRFSVRPGVTCLWQIAGRSGIPFERWIELDLHYIDHWSLWLDFRILLKTIPAVLRGVGAA